MIKTKIFIQKAHNNIEDEMNEFLSSENIQYIDVRVGSGLDSMTTVLVYAETNVCKKCKGTGFMNKNTDDEEFCDKC